MFLTTDQPDGAPSETYDFVGKYRGGHFYIKLKSPPNATTASYRLDYSKARRGKWGSHLDFHLFAETLALAMREMKCRADWELWQDEWVASDSLIHRVAKSNIAWHIHQGYSMGPWGLVGMAEEADKWFKHLEVTRGASVVQEWWRALTLDQKSAFLRDVWICEGKEVEGPAKPSPPPKRSKPDSGKKSKAKTMRHRVRVKASDTPIVDRLFGHCKKCRVCLAYDVSHGCCTVCGRQLTPNPEDWYKEFIGDWILSLYPWGGAWRFELYNEKMDQELTGSEPTRSRALAAARRIVMRWRAKENPQRKKVVKSRRSQTKRKRTEKDRADVFRRMMKL